MNVVHLFGSRLRYLRKKARLSQQRLAEEVRLSPVSISNIERGLYPPAFRRIGDFAKALHVDVHELFLFDASQEKRHG